MHQSWVVMFGLRLLDPDVSELAVLLCLRNVGDTTRGENCCVFALLLDCIRLVNKRGESTIGLKGFSGPQQGVRKL